MIHELLWDCMKSMHHKWCIMFVDEKKWQIYRYCQCHPKSSHEPSCLVSTQLFTWEQTQLDRARWGGKNSLVGSASDWKARCNTDRGSSPWCGKGFFSQSQFQMQTLLLWPHSPRVQLHASTSVQALKIPNTGSQTIVWRQDSSPHTDRNG